MVLVLPNFGTNFGVSNDPRIAVIVGVLRVDVIHTLNGAGVSRVGSLIGKTPPLGNRVLKQLIKFTTGPGSTLRQHPGRKNIFFLCSVVGMDFLDAVSVTAAPSWTSRITSNHDRQFDGVTNVLVPLSGKRGGTSDNALQRATSGGEVIRCGFGDEKGRVGVGVVVSGRKVGEPRLVGLAVRGRGLRLCSSGGGCTSF